MSRPTVTITVRNLPAHVASGLKRMASRRNQSMEQQVRDLLEEAVGDRESLRTQLEEAWQQQARRPARAEVDRWVEAGRGSPAPRRTRRR